MNLLTQKSLNKFTVANKDMYIQLLTSSLLWKSLADFPFSNYLLNLMLKQRN